MESSKEALNPLKTQVSKYLLEKNTKGIKEFVTCSFKLVILGKYVQHTLERKRHLKAESRLKPMNTLGLIP